MKKIYTNDLMPGMVLAADIYNYNNQLVMNAGSILDDKAITKLTFYAIPYARIKDGNDEEESVSDREEVLVPEETSYLDKVKDSLEFKEYKQRFEHVVKNMEDTLRHILKKETPLESLDHMVDEVIELMKNSGSQNQMFDLIHNMRGYDDLTFAHSINVGLICYVMAKWLKLSDEDTRLALSCGLLHDIGKMLIPEDIVRKPSKLTKEEYELMKTHTIEGYKAIKELAFSEHIKNAVLMHHERYDGSGYPLGVKGEQIDSFARMVAIADVYEATTAARKYRGALCPFVVIAIFENEGLQKYDTKMIMTFLENIVGTYMLNRVKLSDGREGEIVFINKNFLSKPVIKCEGSCIDLSKEKDIYISEII